MSDKATDRTLLPAGAALERIGDAVRTGDVERGDTARGGAAARGAALLALGDAARRVPESEMLVTLFF